MLPFKLHDYGCSLLVTYDKIDGKKNTVALDLIP